MYCEFAYKLFNVAMPRIRDFRGVSSDSFDGRGNYTLGIKEQLIIFTEQNTNNVSSKIFRALTGFNACLSDKKRYSLLFKNCFIENEEFWVFFFCMVLKWILKQIFVFSVMIY